VGEVVKRGVNLISGGNRTWAEWMLGCIGIAIGLLPGWIVEKKLSEWWFFFGERVSTQNFPLWLSANREGIVSSFGFISLDLIGTAIARLVKNARVSHFVAGFVSCCGISAILLYFGQYPSRRMANLPFSVAVIAVVLFNLIWFKLVLQDSKNLTDIPLCLRGILKQPLLYFLLSNALTGLVNLTCQTLLFPPTGAILVMTAYLGALALLGRLLA
jgi:hypothetical protein